MKIKKALGVVLVTLLSMLPIIGYAAEKINVADYETLGFRETLKSEEITEEFKNYSESDNQVPIYMFRGQGCGYCKAFLNFLNGIATEYGKYFKLVSFETWYNEENSALLKTISNFVENPAQGVPFIIIGEHVFPGYASDYDESIKTAIMEQYNASTKYDVFDAYNDSLNNKSSESGSTSSTAIIIWDLVFTIISTLIIVITIRKTLKCNCNCDCKKAEVEEVEETEEAKETEKIETKKPNKKNRK